MFSSDKARNAKEHSKSTGNKDRKLRGGKEEDDVSVTVHVKSDKVVANRKEQLERRKPAVHQVSGRAGGI